MIQINFPLLSSVGIAFPHDWIWMGGKKSPLWSHYHKNSPLTSVSFCSSYCHSHVIQNSHVPFWKNKPLLKCKCRNGWCFGIPSELHFFFMSKSYISQNHIMGWVGLEGTLKTTQFQPCTMGRIVTHWIRVPMAPSYLATDVSRDECIKPNLLFVSFL